MVCKKVGLHSQNMLIVVGREKGGAPAWSLNEHENFTL